MHNKGFTIVELLIVVIIIAILATITIIAFNGISQRSKVSAALSATQQLGKKIETYRIDNDGNYPVNKAALGIADPNVTYVQYGGGTGFCASSNNSGVTYYISHLQPTPIEGACEGSIVGTSTCPSGYIPVPGNTQLGTTTFCLMKYEAKNVSGVATSQVAGTPWTSISQASALSVASAACSGCHLMTEAEWMTVAANALSVPTNWSGGSVGSGFIYSGHNDGSPSTTLAASGDDSDGYNGTGNTAPSNQRRTLQLTNGVTIWDLAGNAYELTQGVLTGAQPGLVSDNSSGTPFTTKQWNVAGMNWNNLAASSRPSALTAIPGLENINTWTSSQGIGQLYSNQYQTSARVFSRGGYRSSGLYGGVLTLYLHVAQSSTDPDLGFRAAR